VIPVLTNPSGQSVWPNGTNTQITVVGFAWFVITSCGHPAQPTYCSNSDGKQMNGVFVNLDSSASMGTPGPYTTPVPTPPSPSSSPGRTPGG
jgi:hypothetical protein